MSTERWDIDSSDSNIHFAVRHLLLSKTRGQFRRWTGSVTIPDGDVTRAVVHVVIDASSIDTGVARRDEHLRGADYFDVARYPQIVFTAGRTYTGDDGRLRLVGELTMKGFTREVTLTVVPIGRALDSRGHDRARYSATTNIDRRAFGFSGVTALDAGGLVIGGRIEIEIGVDAVKQSVVRAA